MSKLFSKYKIYGRKKGRKKIGSINQINFSQFIIDLENDLKKQRNIILDIGSGNGESSIFLAKKNPKKLIIACEVFEDGNINLFNFLLNSQIKNLKLFEKNVNLLLDDTRRKFFF